jgi:hypothetical protein
MMMGLASSYSPISAIEFVLENLSCPRAKVCQCYSFLVCFDYIRWENNFSMKNKLNHVEPKLIDVLE